MRSTAKRRQKRGATLEGGQEVADIDGTALEGSNIDRAGLEDGLEDLDRDVEVGCVRGTAQRAQAGGWRSEKVASRGRVLERRQTAGDQRCLQWRLDRCTTSVMANGCGSGQADH